jgi:hypothetical protein
MLFYVNGLLEGVRSLSSVPAGQGAPLTIGARVKNSELEYEFEGLIDEIAVYNTALSPEQIEQRLYTRLTGREPGLVTYWDFDDGSGQVVKDLSGNGNHAYLGTDPDDYDASDPHWNLSDAPLDSCRPAEVILRSLTRAVELKNDILHLLNEALDNEQTTIRLLDRLFQTKEDFHRFDVHTVRRQVRAAILRERLSKFALERTKRRLQTALSILTGELLPATPSEVDAELESADVNVDGMVNFSDLAIMMNHWLESYRPEQQ